MGDKPALQSPPDAVPPPTSSADEVEPVVDQWYLREDTQQRFIVTAYDERAGTVEIQTAEGDVDELDSDEWESLPLVLTGESQDWTESIDNEPADDDFKPGAEEGVNASDEDAS
jgi:hypothetical protein